jgi:hypothetical protein
VTVRSPRPRVSPLLSQVAFRSQTSGVVFNIAGTRKTGCRDVPAMDSQELEQVLSRSGHPIRKSTGQSVFVQ